MRNLTISAVLLCAALLNPLGAADVEPAGGDDPNAIAVDAYIYGYPLVTMEMTRRVMTNTVKPENNQAPMGQFHNARIYPNASFRDVTAPNADTLYSTAWLDLSSGPYILRIPDVKGRYFLMPMLDGWTTVFAAPGKRTTGTGAQQYAITGPGWSGALPEGITEYQSPTNIVWILGRTYSSGTKEDYAEVHAIQDQYALVPLSAYGKPYTPPAGKVDPSIDMKTPVREQVNRLDGESYFKLLTALMKQNPPTPADAPIIERMAKVGIVPGGSFDMSKLDPAVAKALQMAPKAGQSKIQAHAKSAGINVNGWTFTLKTGTYGTDYLQRAYISFVGLGANLPQDAVYPTALVDADGNPLSGANRYMIHLEKDNPPPVNGFWSLTMYDKDYFFVANPLNRFTLSARDKLRTNADGSIDLLIQHESPGGEKESNWLPAPADAFVLMFRFYWPKESLLDGSWKIPPIKRVK